MATLKDISAQLGLSIAHVSRALNGYDDVSAETRERVMAAAQALNYTPNLSARKLVSGRSGMVGLVKRNFEGLDQDTSFIETLIGLSAIFSEENLPLIFHVAPEDSQILDVYSKLFWSGSVDGFVLTEPRNDDRRIEFLDDLKIPFVVHGRADNASEHAYVDIDNYEVGYQLTEYLIRQGHENIILLNGSEDRTYATERQRGYAQALAQAGLNFDQSLIRNGRMSEKFGLISTIEILSNQKASAIICGNVLIAQGVYQALETLGLKVPQDMSVVAHDDGLKHLSGLSFMPNLTTTRSPLRLAWEPLRQVLQKRLAGAKLEDCQIILPLEFIERDSAARAK